MQEWHHFHGTKGTDRERAYRVPFFVNREGKSKPASKSYDIAGGTDLMATFVHLAGYAPAIPLSGSHDGAIKKAIIKFIQYSYILVGHGLIALPAILMLAASAALAQDAATSELTQQQASKLEDQANNPLANITAFNLQNYFIGELTAPDDSANQFWLRYAKPFSVGDTNWLMRASLPVNSFPVLPGGGTETGVGDLNVFAAYLIDVGNPAISFGIGPQITAPTATKDELGSGKWSAGFDNVLFNATSKVIQWGYLLSWQASFAGSENREDVNVGVFQPFLFYQLGKGNYLRSAPIWVYDFEKDTYSVPIGVGFGKAFRRKQTVYNLFVEPQWSVADKGANWPEWQVYMGLNMQFTGR